MTPELISEIQRRIAELEPQEREAWTQVKNIDAQYKPLEEAARNKWYPLQVELNGLRDLLPKSEPTESKAVPF